MSSKYVVMGLEAVLPIPQRTVADIVFNACRQLQHVGTHLASLCLQVNLVSEVAVMVAYRQCIVYVGKHRGVGYACKESVVAVCHRPVGDVGVYVVLLQREVAVFDMLPETAYVKLSWALANYDKGQVKEIMRTPLAGEMSERRVF